ncbi:scavenger receptor cysteine-rich domain-containing protein DMBT1-like [Diadema setosum]|uniref:scavenger receptor cysteine-rich domain-containing protein DMBT1-like n=1 Tax=Diadema setosum TaxID=31175 RepID=UPI003B3B7588
MLGYSGAEEVHYWAQFGEGEGPIIMDNVHCLGSEESLEDCLHNGFLTHDECSFYRGAGVTCSGGNNLADVELKIRLADGNSDREGRVEVNYNGTWGTVCDDAWDDVDADVVCRMLGFPGAVMALPRAHFGPGSGSILLDDVSCYGGEATLLSCWHRGVYSHNCVHAEDASVICARKVRLSGGGSYYQGTVELYYNGTWNSVCDDSWDLVDADVVCRMLGFPGADEAPGMARFGHGSGRILLDNVNCLSYDEDIFDCSHSGFYSHNCVHSEDAGVVCTFAGTTPPALEPEVRLADGGSDREGRVEILYDGTWSTVCDDSWDDIDADVVCRMLGFPEAEMALSGAHFGPGSGNILLDEINCYGTEATLLSCLHAGLYQHDCQHSQDASVVCERKVRLSGDASDYQGTVELYYGGTWNTICDDGWDITAAGVVCRMLGFPGAEEAPGWARFGSGSGQILLDNVYCVEENEDIFDCHHNGMFVHDCSHSEDAGVVCSREGTVTNSTIGYILLLPSVRQYEWVRPYAGAVFAFLDPSWGGVCADTWSQENSDVACRELGFHGASDSRFIPDDIESDTSMWTITVSDVQCGGWEPRLLECQHTWSPDGNDITCHSNELATVACHDELTRGLTEDHREGDGEIRFETPEYSWRSSLYDQPQDGVILMQYAEIWGAVCADRWSMANAEVTCRQLDFGGAYHAGNVALDESFWGIMVNDIECDGWETVLVDCRHSGLGNRDNVCQSGEIAYVSCYAKPEHPDPNTNRFKRDIILYMLPVLFVVICIISVVMIVRAHNWRAVSQQTGTSQGQAEPDTQHGLTVGARMTGHSPQPGADPTVIIVGQSQVTSAIQPTFQEESGMQPYGGKSGATSPGFHGHHPQQTLPPVAVSHSPGEGVALPPPADLYPLPPVARPAPATSTQQGISGPTAQNQPTP